MVRMYSYITRHLCSLFEKKREKPIKFIKLWKLKQQTLNP